MVYESENLPISASAARENSLAERGAIQAERRRSERSVPSTIAELQRVNEILQDACNRHTVTLASAAHELRTPLAVMMGYIDMLLSQRVGALNEQQSKILAEMQSSGIRLSSVVQDFLSYAALETGKLTIRLEVGDLNACVSEVCSIWLPRFVRSGLALYFRPCEKLVPFAFDPHKIQHIVSNLLENALKYTPSGGTVWVSIEPHLWERRLENEPRQGLERRKQHAEGVPAVRVSVADTGPGIPAEFHQEIFEEFFKVPTLGTKTRGMGLGLAIARRLVQSHGGKIWVEGEPGSGSKFSFVVPMTQEASE